MCICCTHFININQPTEFGSSNLINRIFTDYKYILNKYVAAYVWLVKQTKHKMCINYMRERVKQDVIIIRYSSVCVYVS